MAEINLPIKLSIQNLQQIVQEMQSKLGNLKVGSSGFKMMQNDIRKLQAEIDRLQGQASKPFISERQFDSASRSVEKIEDRINQLQIDMSRLKFGDLELNSDQQHQLDEFNNRIKEIQTSLTQLKQQAKADFLASDMGKIWGELNPTAVTKSLDQITRSIESQVTSQQKKIKELENNLNDYQRIMKMGTAAEKFANAKNPLSQEGMGADFSKFFSEDKNGRLSFKAGQKPLFEEWLEQNLNIDPGVAHRLVQNSANQVKQELQDAQSEIRKSLSKSVTQGQKAKVDYNDKNTQLVQQNAELTQNIQMLNAAAESSDKMSDSETQLRSVLSAVINELEKWKQEVTTAAQSGELYAGNARKIKSECQQLHSTLATSTAEFMKQQRVLNNFNAIKMTIVNFMGFRQVLSLVKRGVQDALNHIKELDTVMNRISIVTNMSTGDLWKQVDSYSDMAQKYGVSIKGAYEVSQIYYQQGLQTRDVLTLTNETLKLAKISGLDYAQTTDYMTTALRGFKMEMSEASTVVDVYSNLAAHTAVTQEELAVAMSKTASSMESVGSSFEESSAMIATMVAVTRESATNIGSALKSIAARYGEMKKDPMTLVDSEGEALAFNKVDTALQSVGISMRTTDGQFRDFTDVIIELSEKWNTLESTQQRYIATQFAGNRQQSRFLALVSNADLLKSNLNYAENSEDVGTIQALKALDSIEAKTEQVRVAYQQMYTTIGAEDMWKGFLDGAKNVMNTLNSLPKLFGKLPVGAIAMVADFVKVIKDIGLRTLGGVSSLWDKLLPTEDAKAKGEAVGQAFSQSIADAVKKAEAILKEAGKEAVTKVGEGSKEGQNDANNPAKPATDKQRAEVAAPVQKIGTEAAEQSQHLANAAISTGQMADNQERAAEAAEKQAQASSNISTYTIQSSADLASQIENLGIADTINEQLAGHPIDVNTPVQQIQNMFVQILHVIGASSGQLREAFANASDDAISGYVHTLLSARGVADAGKIVGQISIQALRDAIGAHSDADETIAAAEDYNGGYVHTITSKIDDAANAGKAYAQASIEAMHEELDKGLQQELDSLDAQKLLGSEKISKMYENGLTPVQQDSYYTAFERLKIKKQNIIDEYRPMQAKIDERNALQDQFDELENKKLSREAQINANYTGIVPKQAEGYIDNRYYEASSELQRLTSEKDTKLAAAEQGLEAARTRVDELMAEARNINARLTEISQMGKFEQIKHRGEKEALIARQGQIPAEREAANKAYEEAKIKFKADEDQIAKEYNPQIVQQKQRMGRYAEKAVREYNDNIYEKQRPLEEKINTLNDEISAARSERSAKLREIARSEEELTQQQQRTLEANKEEKERFLKQNDDHFERLKSQARDMTAQGHQTLNAIPTIEAQQAAEAERLRREEEERKRQEEEERKRQEEEKIAYTQSNKQMAAADKARVDTINNQAWDAEAAKRQAESDAALAAYKNGELDGATIPMRLSIQEGAEATITNDILEVKDKVEPQVEAKPIQVPVEPKVASEVVENAAKVNFTTDNNVPDSSLLRTSPYANIQTDFGPMAYSRTPQLQDIAAHGFVGGMPTSISLPSQTEAETKAIEEQTTALQEHTKAVEADNQAKAQSTSSSGEFAAFDKEQQQFAEANKWFGIVTGGQQVPLIDQQGGIHYTSAEHEASLAPYMQEIEIYKQKMLDAQQEFANAQVQAPSVTGAEEVGQQSGQQIVNGQQEVINTNPPQVNEVQGGEAAAESAAQTINETLQSKIEVPELGASLDMVLDTKTGDALDTTQITSLLEKLVELKIITKETKDELLNLYNTRPSEEFVEAYGKATNTDVMIANANRPMEMQTFTPLPQVESPVPQVDTSAQVAQIQALIDKLVEMGALAKEKGEELKAGFENATPEQLTAGIQALTAALHTAGDAGEQASNKLSKINVGTIGSAIRMLASLTGLSNELKGVITLVGGAITLLGVKIQFVDKVSKTAAKTNPWMAIAMGIMAMWNGLSMIIETPAERLERLKKEAEELNNKAKEAKANFKSLDTGLKKLDELKEKRYESEEAAQAYQDAVDELTSQFPALIGGFDEAGNVILNTVDKEQVLADARKESAQATYDAAKAELEVQKAKRDNAIKAIKAIDKRQTNDSGIVFESGTRTEAGNKRRAQIDAFVENGQNGWNITSGYDNILVNSIYEGREEEFVDPDLFIQLMSNRADYEWLKELLDEKQGDTSAVLEEIRTNRSTNNNYKEFYDAYYENQDAMQQDIESANELWIKMNSQETGSTEWIESYKKYSEIMMRIKGSETYKTNQELQDATKVYYDWMEAVNKEMPELNTSINSVEANKRLLISRWQETSTNNGKSWEYLEKSSIMASLVTEKISTDLGNKDFDEAKNDTKIVEQWNKLQTAAEEFYTNLIPDDQKLFNTMMESPDLYSAEDIIKQFNIEDEQIQKLIYDHYDTSVKNIHKRLNNNFKKNFNAEQQTALDSAADVIQSGNEYNIDDLGIDFLTTFEKEYFERINKAKSAIEEKFLNSSLKEYNRLVNSGYTNRARAYGASALKTQDLLDKVSASSRANILKSIETNGLNTQSGIAKVISDVESDTTIDDDVKKEIIDSLKETKRYIFTNLNLDLQTSIDNYLEDWKNNSKILSKAGSGLDIADVNSIINSKAGQRAGITFDSFIQDGDKLILGAEDLKKYWAAYFEEEDSKLQDNMLQLQRARDVWTHHTNGNFQIGVGATFTEEEAGILDSFLGEGKLSEYATKIGDKWVVGDSKGLQKEYDEALKSADELTKSQKKYLEWSKAQIDKTIDWNEGTYKTINELTGQDITELMQLSTQDLNSEKYSDKPDVKKAVTKARTATSNLLKDLTTKPIEEIDFSQYEGLPAEIKAEIQNSAQEGVYSFVKKYSQYIGATTEEVNSLVLDAYEQQIGVSKTSNDAIKDLTFINTNQFTATSSELKAFAANYKLDLATLLEKGIVWYDKALGEYVVNYLDLEQYGVDLTKVQGFQDTVTDSINNFFKKLADLVENGLNGSLSYADATQLQQYAAQFGFEGELDFTDTAEGLRLSEQSALALYDHMKNINSLKASSMFKNMSEYLKESDEHYTSITANHARINYLENKLNTTRAEQQRALKKEARAHGYQTQAGNVDLTAHALHQIPGTMMQDKGWTEIPEDDYATLYTSTYSGKDFNLDTNVVLNITPITNDGKVIKTPQELEDYTYSLLEGGGTAEDIMARDTEHLVMGVWDVDVSNAEELAAGLAQADAEAGRLHEESDAIVNSMDKWDVPSDARIKQYERELELAKEIAYERATTEDSSFDFMNNKIPAAQNNPLTYFENWGKAWKAMKDSFSAKGQDKGLMGYQDFYNIMTEMGHIAEVSGQPIKLGADKFVTDAKSAAALIEEGARCLTVASDGSIKVDLSQFGLDFVGGADEMAGNVNEGIRAIAKAQIAMLDNMIQLMETVVAMEKLSDVDVNANNKLDLNEMFEIEYEDDGTTIKKIGAFKDTYRTALADLIAWANTDAGAQFKEATQKMLISWDGANMSMWDFLNISESTIAGWTDEMKGKYAKIVGAFYTAAKNGNYNLSDVLASSKQIFAESGYEGEISIGDMKLAFKYDASFEVGDDGKIHVGNQDFTYDDAGMHAASKYQHETQLNALKGIAYDYNSETEKVTYKNSIVTNVDYDVEKGNYNIKFADGSSAFADSEAGASLAIATYAKMKGEEIGKVGNTAEPVTFTIYQDGTADLEFTLQDGKVEVVAKRNGQIVGTDSEAKAAAEAAVQEQAEKEAAALSNTTGTATVSNMQIQLAADAHVTIDLEGKTLEVTGTPTAAITTVKIMKDSSFTITGDEEIWKDIVNTKEGEEFTVSVLKLITKQQDGFTNDDGKPIWDLIVNSKEGIEFTASVLSLITSKDANFTNDEGATIWSELVTTKEGQVFTAFVNNLITSQASDFKNDNGKTIWDLVDPNSDPFTFNAQVLQLITTYLLMTMVNQSGNQ